MILRDDHAVKDLDSVVPKLIVVAETKIHDMPDKRVKVRLISLRYSQLSFRE